MKKFLLFSLFSFFLFSGLSAQMITPLGHGVRTNGYIDAMAYDSTTGYIYAGGYFENIGGIETQGIAMWNGIQWLPMGGGLPGGYVSSICIINGDIYAGGSFENAGGVAVKNIARWDGIQWHAVGTSPVTYYTVMSLAEWNGELLLSAFLSAPLGPGTGIARWDGNNWTGLATTSTTNASIYLHTDHDSLYAYGYFNDLNGVNVYCAATFDQSGNVIPMSFPVTVNYIQTAVKYNNALYAVDNMGNLMHHTPSTGWVNDSTIFDSYPYRLFIYKDSLHISCTGNSMSPVDTLEVWNIYNGTKFKRIGVGATISNYHEEIRCVLPVGNNLYIGGTFSRFDGRMLLNSSRYDGTSWHQFAGAALTYGDAWKNANVSTMVYDTLTSQLYVGGSFLFAGDSIISNVARWDGSQWHSMGGGFNGTVYKMLMYQDTLYACGNFTRSGLDTVKRMAKWNGNSWMPVGAGASSGTVVDMIVFNNILYAGGSFTNFNGIAADRCIQFNGTNWSIVGSNDLGAIVDGFVIFNNALVAYSRYGFDFNWPNTSNIAELSGNNWLTTYNFPYSPLIHLYVFNNDMYGSSYDFTTQWTDQAFKYNNGLWTDMGFLNNETSGASFFKMQNKLCMTAWNDRTYEYDGTSWSVLFDWLQVADIVEMGNSQFILGGFFPYMFDGLNTVYLYNIGAITLSAPVATFTQDVDTVCDHQYVQFVAPPASVPVTVEWQFPGGIPSTSNDLIPIVKYNVPGNYNVYFKITNAYGVDSTVSINAVTVLNCSLGIPENDAITISVFPNPAHDRVDIHSDNPVHSYSISDLSGNILIASTEDETMELTIDVSNYATGIYFLNIISGESSIVKKLIVNH